MPYIIFVPLDGVPGSMHLSILVCYACFLLVTCIFSYKQGLKRVYSRFYFQFERVNGLNLNALEKERIKDHSSLCQINLKTLFNYFLRQIQTLKLSTIIKCQEYSIIKGGGPRDSRELFLKLMLRRVLIVDSRGLMFKSAQTNIYQMVLSCH